MSAHACTAARGRPGGEVNHDGNDYNKDDKDDDDNDVDDLGAPRR